MSTSKPFTEESKCRIKISWAVWAPPWLDLQVEEKIRYISLMVVALQCRTWDSKRCLFKAVEQFWETPFEMYSILTLKSHKTSLVRIKNMIWVCNIQGGFAAAPRRALSVWFIPFHRIFTKLNHVTYWDVHSEACGEATSKFLF